MENAFPSPDMTDGEILVVEDTPESLILLTGLLTRAGFTVRQAPDGELALWSARAQAPELILLDVRMPGMDGYEVCRQMKQIDSLRDVPIIFLSAHTDTADKLRGFEAGGVDYISKPYNFQEVNARVVTHLKLRRLQQQLAWQNENLQFLVEAKAKELADTQVSLMAERHQRDAAEEESRRRLAEIAHMNRNASATAYCASLVHELNQPLGAILANAQAGEMFLRKDPPDLVEVGAILVDIQRDDQRVSELIKRMRDMLKKSEAATEVLDLNALADGVVTLLASEARMRKIFLGCALDPAALPAEADKVQLQQVLVNLVINSMDAIGSAGGERRIEVSTARLEHGEAEIRVSDTGCGFGEHLGQVFESFFTTKPNGMGLGLSISSGIITAHGGRLRAENREGGGAVVSCRLLLHPSAVE